MNKFEKVAQEQLAISELMADRDKIETEELVGKKITINDIDRFTLDGEEVWVYTIEEMPDYFAFAGLVLKQVFENWVKVFGSLQGVRNELREDGCKVIIGSKITKNKNKCTTVKIGW